MKSTVHVLLLLLLLLLCLDVESRMCDVWVRSRKSWSSLRRILVWYLLSIATIALLALRCFYPVATLDHVGLERDWSWAAMKLKEEATCIAEYGAGLVASP